MRAILEDIRFGEVTSHEVPRPELRPGGILVRTAFSAISAGTELAYREQVKKSLLGKALARPDLVRQVVEYARTAGATIAIEHAIASGEVVSLPPRRFRRSRRLPKNSDARTFSPLPGLKGDQEFGIVTRT